MTWKPLGGAENRQIRLVGSLSPCYFGTAAGDRGQPDMLFQGRILPGLQGLKETPAQKTSLTPFLIASVKKNQTRERRRLSPQQPGGCGVLSEARV